VGKKPPHLSQIRRASPARGSGHPVSWNLQDGCQSSARPAPSLAAVTAQNECQLVVLLAEARIGAELKAAQDAGAMAKRNEPVSQYVQTSDIPAKATLPEIGIPRQRASEMKRLAEVGEPAIRAEVKRANDEGRRPRRYSSWWAWRERCRPNQASNVTPPTADITDAARMPIFAAWRSVS